jgi:60S ribosome subunit biogenesis protein NIP7
MAAHTRAIWVYYMPSKKKKLRFRKGVLPQHLRRRFVRLIIELYGEDVVSMIPASLRYTCFEPGLCIVYEGDGKLNCSLTILYEGPWIAFILGKRIVPSIPLVSRIFREKGVKAAVLVKEQGIKAFLYGNDILPESVIKIIPPLKGVYAVVNPLDEEVVGFVEWSSIKNVYVNIYDAGVFLRKLG